MKKRLLCAVGFLAASLGIPTTGQASIFEIHLHGRVTHVGDLTGTVDPLVQVGDRVKIDIGYDAATPDLPLYADDPTRGAYLSPGWIHIIINDLVFAIDGGLQVDVIEWPDGDYFQANAGTLFPGSVISQWPAALPIFPILGGGVGLFDTKAPFNLLSSDALPTAPLHWGRANIASGHVGAGTDDLSMYDISFQVPEPTTIALAGLGIAWAMARRHRR